MKERIKKVRLDADLNQTEFSKIIGCASNTVSGWESGEERLQKFQLNQSAVNST